MRRRSTLLHAVVTLCTVLGACSPAQPGEPEVAPTSTKAQALAVEAELSPDLLFDPSAITGTQHNTPAVAAGNGIYLLVWMEYSPATSDRPDIRAVRVRASDGARLDANPLVIASGLNVQYQPAVAFDGTNFLVVYTEITSVPAILGKRVRASDGAVLDSPALYLGRTPMGPYQLPQLEPAVAFDGTNYLVTWSGHWFDSSTGAVKIGIQAIRVRPSDGSCIEPSSTFVAAGGNAPRVAYTDGTYLVTWSRNSDVEAARISASTGQVLDASPLRVAATSATERTPAVAAQSGDFLVTWIGLGNVVWGRRLRASDGSALDAAEFAVGPPAVAAPEATFDGVDYWITWSGTLDGKRKALAARVSPSGGVAAVVVLAEVPDIASQDRGGIAAVGPGRYLAAYASYDYSAQKPRGQLRLMTDRSEHVSPELSVPLVPMNGAGVEAAVAAGNGLYLVVWTEANSTTGGRPDIFGVRVRASDGAQLDASPLRIGGVPSSADIFPAVAFDGTNFLVVWEGIDSVPVINGARVRASDGAVLDATPLLISHPPTGGNTGLPQFNPAVAFDGKNYLVTWDGLYYDNGPIFSGIQATRVRPSDGSTIEASSIIVVRNGAVPRVAYANGNYLVTWSRTQNVEAARLSAATGQVLDTTPIPVAVTAGSERSPTVAARNGEFLVAWIGGDNGLWGRRLGAADGVKLGSADISLGASALTPPEVTFDGLDYRILWLATRGGVRTLVGTRVSSEGEVAADAELRLSLVSSNASLSRPAIAAAGPGHLLTLYAQYDAAAARNRVRGRLVTDEQTPAVCELPGNPTLVLNGAAPLMLECGSGAYSDPGAQAFDACGNPIEVHAYNTGADSSGPGPNLRYEGTYSVSYSAWDAMGHTVNASRQVIVDDRTAPTLTLKGAARMTHTCGSQWVDPGVDAMDLCYGNVAPQVQRSGSVNGWAVGTYTVTYSLTDAGGNSATPVTRTVDVVNCPW